MSADTKPITNVEEVPPATSRHAASVDPESRKLTWRGYIWDTLDMPPAERRLLLKVDLTILTFGCLGTFIKYIDKANLTSAFVSGMKEDMSLYGNEMNYANTAYSVANILALWPCNLALTRCNPRWFIPFLEIAWTIVTLGQAFMHTPTQMYVLRFILGVFETGHFSAMIYLCGAWYQKTELSKRVAIINCSTSIGPMFSSYLQSAAYTGLNGVHGRAGWRWLFIIDAIVSIGIIIPQFFFYPDVPARQQPDFIFTHEEIELARDRNPKEGRVKQGEFTLAQVKRWFTTPDIFLLWIIAMSNSICHMPQDSMAYWFKAWNSIKPNSYSVVEINNYTTGIGGVTVVLMLIFAWLSDSVLRGRRWPLLVVGGIVTSAVCFTLAATPVFPQNKAFRWFLYYNTNWAFAANSMYWSWAQDTLAGDPATRAFGAAGLNVVSYITIAVVPLFAFQTVDQPGVVGGNFGAGAFGIVYAGTALLLAYIQHRREVKQTVEEDSDN
ncbi:unnamed protein product [Clonostachys rosea]|uniref:Major facilitator superfamily (MFS) profile domain-containing protein n=1 Tax=Bionectria ochroleuca TaxID=29856 RepID=A0ABY6U6S4_BIOOC|nr:unnamed protein product [Clonostachys rosea]